VAAKKLKFRLVFGQLRDFIANFSGTQQDIVNQKTALQTMDTFAPFSGSYGAVLPEVLNDYPFPFLVKCGPNTSSFRKIYTKNIV